MEKQKLIKLINKIFEPKFDGMSPTDVYTHFTGTYPYTEFYRALPAEDIIMVSFLLPFGNTPKVLDEKYDFIQLNLFGFTVVEIDNDYSEVECPECYGNGTEECPDCSGEGEEECGECGGSGEDEEGGGCDVCDGEGKEECSYCEGDGQINCGECGGSGNYDDYDKRDISQWFYVSYDKTIHDEFMSLDEWDEINNEEFSYSKQTISLLRKETSIDAPYNVEAERNDVYFYEFTEEPDFSKTGRNRIDINSLSDL
jgi:hypothetical protein